MRQHATELFLAETEGDTPVHKAVKKGDLREFELLIKSDADLEKRNQNELTPVDIIISEISNSPENCFKRMLGITLLKCVESKINDSIIQKCLLVINEHFSDEEIYGLISQKTSQEFLIANLLRIRRDFPDFSRIKYIIETKETSPWPQRMFFGRKEIMRQFFLMLEARVVNEPWSTEKQEELSSLKTYIEKNKINVDEENERGETPLDIAIRKKDAPLIFLLTKMGAKKINEHTCQLLLKKISLLLSQDERLIFKAFDFEDAEIDAHFNHALSCAITNNAIDDVKYYVGECGANVNYHFKNDITPLHTAALTSTSCEIVEYLLNCGAEPNAIETRYNARPIDLAIAQNKVEMIKVFLKHGANINGSQTFAKPVTIAISGGRFTIAKLLIENGAEWSSIDKALLLKNQPTTDILSDDTIDYVILVQRLHSDGTIESTPGVGLHFSENFARDLDRETDELRKKGSDENSGDFIFRK